MSQLILLIKIAARSSRGERRTVAGALAEKERVWRVASEYKIIPINELSYEQRTLTGTRVTTIKPCFFNECTFHEGFSCRTGLIAVGHFTVVECNSLCRGAKRGRRCSSLSLSLSDYGTTYFEFVGGRRYITFSMQR